MNGGNHGGGVATEHSGTWVMGSPVPPQTHQVNQHAYPPNSYPCTSNPTPSVAVNHSNGGDSGSSNPYVHASPVQPGPYNSYPSRRPMDRIYDMVNLCGKRLDVATRKAESIADSVWNHLKTGPRVADAAMARLNQGTKVLTEGGQEKVFQHTFATVSGEKLLKAYACYLSTTTGPVIGTLYLSKAFCSDFPLCYYSSTGQQEWIYYKVVVLLDKISSVNPSANPIKPSDKYIQVVTTDGHEFWFMGFISFDNALKHITKALDSTPFAIKYHIMYVSTAKTNSVSITLSCFAYF